MYKIYNIKSMRTIRFLAIVTIVALCVSCEQQGKVNTLTKKEKADGWVLLFDGKTTNGWHNWNQDTLSGWIVEDSSLVGLGLGGDITAGSCTMWWKIPCIMPPMRPDLNTS